jgi:hypothetical protein
MTFGLVRDVLGRKTRRQDADDRPFMHSLAGIRKRIAGAVESEVRKDIESAGDRP